MVLVKDNDRVVSTGTFFLLTESLGLTCFHVVKDVRKFPHYRIMISFNYNPIEEEHYLPAEIEAYSERYNYAFLRVAVSLYPGGPGGLLPNLAPPPQHGTVTIISNYKSQIKTIPYYSMINLNNREDPSLPQYNHILDLYNGFEFLDPKNYEANLCEGASGAPVFSDCGELVAMHTGDYTPTASAIDNRVVEHGRSAVEINSMGAVEIEDLGRQFLEVVQTKRALRNYMSFGSHAPHMRNVITQFMKLGKAEIKRSQVEAPKVTQRMRVWGFPKWTPNNKTENEKQKDEPKRRPLSLEITLSIEFVTEHEDDLHDVLANCSHFISQRAFTLGRLLDPSLYTESDKPSDLENCGFSKCKAKKCRTCKYVKEGKTFSSYHTDKSYDICHLIDCNSSHVVYLISCTSCRLQYVGYTEGKLKIRIFKHLSDSNNGNAQSPSMVSKHFYIEHKEDLINMKIQGIQMINKPERAESWTRLLLNEEAFWIWTLNTIHPNGLNLKCDFAHCDYVTPGRPRYPAPDQ
ncbi:uncharacterized protein LOC143774106 [Ranitomeya variabilis]|uniref:uncharacterized protein LOC143774106 n=1 Tax=Ranitomeya variabilis TaxID=490064 RepID=UPI004055BC7D